MKKIQTTDHCVKVIKLNREKNTALIGFSWNSHFRRTFNVDGVNAKGEMILKDPWDSTVQYRVLPEDGQIKLNEWLQVVTEVL